MTSITLKGLRRLTQDTGGEWLYVFIDGTWFAAQGGVAYFGMPADQQPGELKHLADVIAALPAPTPLPVAI